MQQLKDYKIAFMGQTGRGKSSLMNVLFGTEFKVDSVEECTKCINSSLFLNDNSDIPYQAYSIIDTPGIGASEDNNEYYRPYYLHILDVADCIVWVTNMMRTDRADQEFFLKFKENFKKSTRFIIAVNQIDILSPHDLKENEFVWDFKLNEPTATLNYFLFDEKDGRIPLIRKKMAKYIPTQCPIVPVNAFYKFGLNNLKSLIFNI